jgi:integrase
MSNTYRRCGCRGRDGKQLGPNCPKLKSDSRHGSYGYYLSAGVDPRTQQRRQFRKAGFPTRKAAQSALAKLKASLDGGSYVEPTRKVLAIYAQEVLARWQNRLRDNTLASYGRYIKNDIGPSRLGEMVLTDIRRSHIDAFIKELENANRGVSTVRHIHTTLRRILTIAVKDELIPTNPALVADLPAENKGQVKHWEPVNLQKFLERCGRHRLGAVFELTMYTGQRRGEICGLRWSDIDDAERTITVSHNRVSVDGRIIKQADPKTRAGRRTVDLPDQAVAALIAWKFHQDQERENAAEAWIGDDHVFTMEDGRALNPSYVTRLFDQLRKQGEELSKLTPHSLRHSYASALAAAGVQIAVASKLMGHSSISITADLYTHMFRDTARADVNKAANLIAHKVHTPERASTNVG